MNDDQVDRDLQNLFTDAVADVVPGDRLGEIRRATAHTARKPRRWTLVLAAGTATAAVVGAGAALGQLGLPNGDDVAGPSNERTAVATYFLGDSPFGTRLFREFQTVPTDGNRTIVALEALRLLEADAGPQDPDYRTDWADGSFVGVQVVGGLIRIELADRVDPVPAPPAAQQAIYTVQAALGQTLPVQMTTSEGTVDINGDGTSEAIRDAAILTPLNITDPVEGRDVDERFTARGTVAPMFDELPTAITWTLTDDRGGFAAQGTTPVTNRTWSTVIATGDLDAGTYTLSVALPGGVDPATIDTRTVTVR